ncbi:MAG: alpha/beta hydrolase [Segetibacter sp.]|nr:alpha/beta hydrolase [Segetibacter sp.]
MPVILLILLLTEFLTIAFIVLDVHLIREWYLWKDTYDEEYARRCLYVAIACTAYIFLGKFPTSWLVSKFRKNEDEPKQEHSQFNENLKRPDGSVINIDFYGDDKAQPLLFVHGWNANSTEWYYQKIYFSKNYRVILIDLPGLGKSTRPANKDFSLQKMAADLEAVIEHLKLSKAVLWGHSIGGMVILTYCTQVGKNVNQKVKGIVLQHTTFTNPTLTSIASGLLRAIEKPILYPICYIMIALSPVFWLSKWMSYMNGNLLLSTRFLTFTGTQTPAQLNFISRLSAMAPPAVFARGMLGMMKTYDVSKDLKDLNIPTLILAAKYDRLTKPVASDYMHSNIPNAQLATLSPAGHQGLVERHAETNETASKFIAGLKLTN